jgi:hypothetical protein
MAPINLIIWLDRAGQPQFGDGASPREAAGGESEEAVMAVVLVILFATAVLAGAIAGIFLTISFAIRREDRAHSLSLAAPDRAARSARLVVGRPVDGHRSAREFESVP